MKRKSFLFLALTFLAILPPREVKATGDLRPIYRGLRPFYGDLHAHTAYSLDGPNCKFPADLFDAARARGNDFATVTDHDGSIFDPTVVCDNPSLPRRETKKWEKTKEAANQKNRDGEFVALWGFEWTHPSPDHINVINSQSFLSQPVYQFNGLGNWLLSQPDKSSIIAQFNHPYIGEADFFTSVDRRLIPIFKTIELTGVEAPNRGRYIYAPFLQKGWKLGAVGSGDSHNLLVGRSCGVWTQVI